jgi:hypothetical protein
MTTAERLEEAEEIVTQLRMKGQELDPERIAKLERLRVLVMIERIFPSSKLLQDVKPLASVEDLPAGDRSSCTACGRGLWWVPIHGGLVCGHCHPPPAPELVARWLGGHDA